MTKRNYEQVAKAVFDRPWALMPSMMAVIAEVVRLRIEGHPLTDEEIEARVNAASNGPRNGPQRAGAVAVIPIYGVLSQRMNMMSAMSGGTSVEQLQASFRDALADPDVGNIVFDIDSPGGSVDGIEEFATEVRAARGGDKRIVAHANSLMASAAYWIGAQADEVVATPSAQVGSIGIFAMHQEVSKAAEIAGVKTTIVSAGKYKVEGNEFEPLSEDAHEYLQGQVDDIYNVFVTDVAKGRGTDAATVRKEYGEGRILLARKALKAGMVDRVETLEAAIERVALAPPRRRSKAAAHRGGVAYHVHVDPLTPESPAPLPDEVEREVVTETEEVTEVTTTEVTTETEVKDDEANESADDATEASTPAFTEQVAALASTAADILAHARERARLRAKEGRPVLSAENRANLEATADMLGTIRSDLTTFLAADEPKRDDLPTNDAAWRRRASLEVLEAAQRGGYSLPTSS